MSGERLHQQAQHGLQGVRHPQLQRARRPREDLGPTRERRFEESGKENEIELKETIVIFHFHHDMINYGFYLPDYRRTSS